MRGDRRQLTIIALTRAPGSVVSTNGAEIMPQATARRKSTSPAEMAVPPKGARSAMRNAKSLSCRNRTEVVRNPKPNKAKGTMRASTRSGEHPLEQNQSGGDDEDGCQLKAGIEDQHRGSEPQAAQEKLGQRMECAQHSSERSSVMTGGSSRSARASSA